MANTMSWRECKTVPAHAHTCGWLLLHSTRQAGNEGHKRGSTSQTHTHRDSSFTSNTLTPLHSTWQRRQRGGLPYHVKLQP
jgi:hypothetical protein